MALLLLSGLCEPPALSVCLENAPLVNLSQTISLHCPSLLGALSGALTALIGVSFNPFYLLWTPPQALHQ